ncbi:MAG: TerB family tellurite resistance protein [Balneolaceae bacterium]|nr:TerB family tellurite resistance protein [Balneolaceae bacterium]
MSFELNNEKATDVLIWWVEGADGSIDYREEETVKEVLEDVNYSLETFYQETLMHLGGLSNENLKELVDDAIAWGSEHFDDHRKQQTVALLYVIAECNGTITDEQQEKIDRIEEAFGVDEPEDF